MLDFYEDCAVPNLSKNDIKQLQNVLSKPRFLRYVQACNGNHQQAIDLYRWNLVLSGNFLISIHTTVVTLRNGIVEAIAHVYGEEWPWSRAFRRSLPKRQRKSLRNSCDRVEKKGKGRVVGKVVADMSLYFWQGMLAPRHHAIIWDAHLKTAFPNIPSGQNTQKNREKLLQHVIQMRELRNRIAHYEPIFPNNLTQELTNMEEIVSWRSQVTANWMKTLHDLDSLIASDPRQ